jgi:hypothetical protein
MSEVGGIEVSIIWTQFLIPVVLTWLLLDAFIEGQELTSLIAAKLIVLLCFSMHLASIFFWMQPPRIFIRLLFFKLKLLVDDKLF